MREWALTRAAVLLSAVLFAACGGADGTAAETDVEPGQYEKLLKRLHVPLGFEIAVWAEVPAARSLTRSGDGTVFVGTRSDDKVWALRDGDGDGTADRKWLIDEGLWTPNGVEFHQGDLYVAEINRVLRYPGILGRLDSPPEPDVVRGDFPEETHHGWKFIAIGPDGMLYVPVGAPCNICNPDDERFASITRMNLDGSDFEVYAHGVRNTVGFDWSPGSGVLWFTDNGRDWLGDNRPPDELNRAPVGGMHFGYPYVHGSDVADPEFGGQMPDTLPWQEPALELGPHVAALGMRFYDGGMFPADYAGDILIAEHGSWNRSTRIGYRVMRVHIKDGRADSLEVFARGWLRPDGRVLGRPVDVLVMPDGSLLISDDDRGLIYRVTHGE